MDFQLTAEQEDVREGMRKLCAGRFPIAALREQTGLDRGWWAELAEAGVFTLRRSEGAGLGMAEAALVFEELGRGLVPGPLIWTHLAGATDVVGGAERTDGPVLIEHLQALDSLLLLDDSGVQHVDPSALHGTEVPGLDPFTPVWRVDSLPAGTPVEGPEVASAWRMQGAALAAAQLAGIAGGLVTLTVAYTKERKQFGRPVGSFQALKHTMADMLVRAELARIQAYAAATLIDEASPAAARAVSAAKTVAASAARRNAADSLQCHGGMGYTWEVDSHLYLKRAWVLDASFGSGDDHADVMAGYLEGD